MNICYTINHAAVTYTKKIKYETDSESVKSRGVLPPTDKTHSGNNMTVMTTSSKNSDKVTVRYIPSTKHQTHKVGTS